jgi:phthiodiolone/phenolphthiodiolone dimycocerosates ketoreductase
MKLGIMLPTVHSIELNVAALRGAEALGVDDVWINDHLMGWTHPELWSAFPAAQVLPDPDAFLDPFVTAGALSGLTALRMGFCVMDVTRTGGPDLARAALTLQGACQGGFVLGVGAGEAESILPFGYPWKTPVGNLERALRQVRALLDTGRMPDGGVGRTGIDRSTLPKVWVAAMKPRTLELTGRYADGWLPLGAGTDAYAEQYGAVTAAAERAGRPLPEASLLHPMLFGESRDRVAALLEELPEVKLVAMFGPAEMWRRHGVEHPGGPDCRGQIDIIPHALDPAELRAVARRIPFELFEEFVIVGNADEVARRVKPFAEIGAVHLLLADITGTTYEPQEAQRHLSELAKLKPLLEEM